MGFEKPPLPLGKEKRKADTDLCGKKMGNEEGSLMCPLDKTPKNEDRSSGWVGEGASGQWHI